MFQRFILPAVNAAVLIINKSFKLPSDSHAQQSQSQLPVLVRDGPQLSLTSHFILSMRVIRNKPQGPVCRNKLVLLYLCNLLLAESYAPEPNPGPRTIKFPRGVCSKACKWSTPCVCCDSCDIWYHQECMGMPDAVFKGLKGVSWECVQCGLPNFSTCIFDSTLETSNSFTILSDTTHTDSEISFSCPAATSSPRHTRQPSTNDSCPDRRYDLPMRILVVNCQSIKSPGKKALLQNMIESTQADIVIGTESWLDGSIRSSEVFPSNFRPYRRDRSTGAQGGGVFLLVSDKFQSNEPEELQSDHCEVVWSRIKIKGVQDLYVGAFYRPPSATEPEYLDHLSSCLSRIPRGAHLWLGGDFNLGDIDWEDECPVPKAVNATQCSQLLSVVKDAFLEQMVSSPTRIIEYSSNLLDLFLTNNRTLVNKCEVIPGIGDHEAVYVESSMRPMKVKTPPRKVFQYKKADYDQMREDLRDYQTDFTEQTKDSSANDTWTKFEEKLKELTNKHIPSKMLSGNKIKKPWMDRTVKAQLRKVKKLFAKQKQTGKARHRRQYLKTKSQAQKEERQAYWKYVENIIELGDSDQEQQPSKQKRFFSFIKSLKRDSSGIAPLRDQGKLHSDPADKANILNNQYQSQFTEEDKTNIPQPEGEPSPTMPDINVTTEGIRKLLQKLNVNKATGPDMIPARILKELSEEIAPFLCTIYQKCLETGSIPDVWKTANVSAIFKKGEKFKASNYRPVSLTCISCKMFEHIILSNIMRHLDKHKLLTDCQHGFRRRRSCETQLLTLADELIKGLDRGRQLDLAILDFSKAFDRVPHERLLKKLDHYGIRGKTLEWIRAFLTNRTQKVTVEGVVSESIHVKSGVPQGSVLGPILFLVFINDLPASVQSSSRLFADDCVVYREIRSDKDCQILQDDLQKLWEWEKLWGMSFHPEKCSIL